MGEIGVHRGVGEGASGAEGRIVVARATDRGEPGH